MAYQTINPATGECVASFDSWTAAELESALAQVSDASPAWAATSLDERCRLMKRLAEVLRAEQERWRS